METKTWLTVREGAEHAGGGDVAQTETAQARGVDHPAAIGSVQGEGDDG